MKSSSEEILPLIGTALGGGFYVGRTQIDGNRFALVAAPKALGEHPDTPWSKSSKAIAGATSYCDGLANTIAMAEGGSQLARWMLELKINGETGWYLPAQDELEIAYRNLKPTVIQNYCYGRSGINISALPPTYPYTPDSPAQTLAEAFQEGGAEAFDPVCYWSSTQHASDASYAWYQDFDCGHQYGNHKSVALRARAFRRLPL